MTGRIIGNREHGYAVIIDGLCVSGFTTRAAAREWITRQGGKR